MTYRHLMFLGAAVPLGPTVNQNGQHRRVHSRCQFGDARMTNPEEELGRTNCYRNPDIVGFTLQLLAP